MGYIAITQLSLVPTPVSNITVNIEYKLDSDPDMPGNWTQAGTGVTVEPTGIIPGGFNILGLVDGVLYNVRITPTLCGTGNTETFRTGFTTTTTTSTTTTSTTSTSTSTTTTSTSTTTTSTSTTTTTTTICPDITDIDAEGFLGTP